MISPFLVTSFIFTRLTDYQTKGEIRKKERRVRKLETTNDVVPG